MSLTSRITVSNAEEPEHSPEDIFSSSLSIIFPDDVTNQHGVAEQSIRYVSPHLPKPLVLDLAKPVSEEDRYLFGHYLWNASLLLAELIERDSLPLPAADTSANGLGKDANFDVRGLEVMEVGAGTGLPSIMAGLLGARRVVVTDYPAPTIMTTLQASVVKNIRSELAPSPASFTLPEVVVDGHVWGNFSASDPICSNYRQCFDRIFVCDCLWMPEQHANLHRSLSYFLRADSAARAWVIAGFHTGRGKLRGFFDAAALAVEGLEVDTIWERECNGNERAWEWDREEEDKTLRKRWLVVASLKRTDSFLES
ncbi:hypothetical protein NLU13_6134 [Sarocladium strictum]|uniref:Nicotinamide N-methyltransferase n=1 Tax=Sarocladium strictum TaxID=5046 RepID=A0AA39L6U8_SARSR|nr:hypothetical protein NLU13_6134 [Sarocladium strictum]